MAVVSILVIFEKRPFRNSILYDFSGSLVFWPKAPLCFGEGVGFPEDVAPKPGSGECFTEALTGQGLI